MKLNQLQWEKYQQKRKIEDPKICINTNKNDNNIFDIYSIHNPYIYNYIDYI
jgi:hypothetical protein